MYSKGEDSIKIIKEYIKENLLSKKIIFFFDIETLQYNEKEGKEKPSKYKNIIYSLCVGIPYKERTIELIFNNFKGFFDFLLGEIIKNGKPITKAKIELIAHNNNKYDNHFLLQDLIYYYPGIERYNIFLNQSLENENTMKIKELTIKNKNCCTLEKRVKTSNNLELKFYLFNICFFTTDNRMKTNASIKVLGEKLKNINILDDSQLKTEFDYIVFNKDEDMEDEEARKYSYKVFNSLTENQLTYIYNDVTILGNSVIHFDKLFPNFDYSLPTFTSNVVKAYNDNNLTSFQLLNKIYYKGEKIDLNYTDYKLCNENYYDFLKSFFRGGLNFYNDKYIGKHLKGKFFSIDINSSYPYVMYAFKIPTFIKDFKEFEIETYIDIEINDNIYYLYRCEKEYFNTLLKKIKSKNIIKMLVKYYNGNEYININTYTIKILKDICNIKLNKIKVLGYVSYECVYFGARDKIKEFYKIKCQDKLKNEIIMHNPMEYYITDKVINKNSLTEEEINISKVMLNGIYGAPSLRAYFNLFKLDENLNIYNNPNGFKNSERNILFSVFVTSVALYNLLTPLKYLTNKEKDDCLLYMDTDSCYFDYKIYNKIPKNIYDDLALGKWSKQEKENEYIAEIIILNHKKYAYILNTGKIIIKSGGIRGSSFNIKNIEFKDFINDQFKEGVKIKNIKNIFNEQGTISIYESTTDLDKGGEYKTKFSIYDDFIINKMMNEIRNNEKFKAEDDFMYIESNLGSFSMQDVYPVKHEIKNKTDLFILDIINKRIKKIIERENK